MSTFVWIYAPAGLPLRLNCGFWEPEKDLGMEWIQASEKHFLKALQLWNVCWVLGGRTQRKFFFTNKSMQFFFLVEEILHIKREGATDPLQSGSLGHCEHSWPLQDCSTARFCQSCYLCVCALGRRKDTLCFPLLVQQLRHSCDLTD